MTMKLVTTGWILLSAAALPAAEVGKVDYATQVKPLLREKCYACHGAVRTQSGLRLDTAKQLTAGGESGAAIVPGKPEESLLIDVLTGDAGFQMPPKDQGARLTKDEIALIAEWIRQGAAAPADEEPQHDPKSWWSYQPIRRPELPAVDEAAAVGHPIDRFIAARRNARTLGARPEAPKEVWLRRAYLDLIGLPPTRAQQNAFLADDSAVAYENVVDGLLVRPEYGERWGRHWMDIWRYSDWYGSRGINEIRYSQRHIWRWRDWIIESLNADKGYDRMIQEMVAGDELAGDHPDTLAATGYLGRNWYKFDRNVWMFETIERTGEAFLGLTFRCCRCHDHKYDPIAQEDYYRFRAFFEPHNVRTDPVSALNGTQKDATQGQVPTDGLARVFDKDLEAVTYRFNRGDGRYPDESKKLTPGVPASLGGIPISIKPVELPAAAFYPALREGVRQTFATKAEQDIQAAMAELKKSQEKVEQLTVKLAQLEAGQKKDENQASDSGGVFLSDDFAAERSDTWQVVNGTWKYEDGHLIEKDVTSFATIVSKQNHPRNFSLTLKYRALQPGTYRSIGLSFDYQDKGNSQDVYTSTGDSSQSVQAFHRTGGGQVYPQAGIVRTKLKVGEIVTLVVTAKANVLTIDLNGERKLNYTMPIPRKDGKFALWVHQGSAEFQSLEIRELTESVEQTRLELAGAQNQVGLRELDIEIAKAKKRSVEARLAAELAKHFEDTTDEIRNAKALAAGKAQHEIAVAESRRALTEAEQNLALLKNTLSTETPADKKSDDKKDPLKTSEDAVVTAQDKLTKAVEAAGKPEAKYEPLGTTYPQTSTGRRMALAKWIASEANPRTARVAANHIWNRHFGRPLVDTTQNFGLNGAQPTHPQLLDWLASELISNGWKMKPLHRAIVLSQTYRMSSAKSGADADFTADPENRYFWRMNSRRMEAEVVRDSVLHLAGRLDLTRGGPEIPETDGEKVLRRSVYFRNTPNEKMPFLETFDVADPNSCYRRKESVVPHQALAMMNSGLSQDHARAVAAKLAEAKLSDSQFIEEAFRTVLTRTPTKAEFAKCSAYLAETPAKPDAAATRFTGAGTAKTQPASDPQVRSRENLIHVLLLHNDFVTIR